VTVPLPRVLVVHGPGAASAFDVLRGSQGVAQVTFVHRSLESLAPGDRDIVGALESIDMSALEIDELAQRSSDLQPRGVVTFSEDLIEVTAELARRLGLTALPRRAVDGLTCKLAQRQALAAGGVAVPRFVPVVTGEDLTAAAAWTGLPAILKPLRGSGSRNTYAVDDHDDLVALAGEMEECGPFDDGGLLLEERLVGDPDRSELPWGDYVSVESASGDGQSVHVAVTGRRPLLPPFRERGLTIPAALSDEALDAVLVEAGRALAALGVTHGITHTEIKLTADGPRVIEVNGRLGGYIGELVRMQRAGFDLVAEGLRLSLGLAPAVTAHRFDQVVYVSMVSPPLWATRLLGFEGVEEATRIPGVTRVIATREPGDTVDWRLGTEQHAATVWGAAPNHVEAARSLRQVDSVLRARWA